MEKDLWAPWAAVRVPSLMYCCDPQVINHTTGGVGGRGGRPRNASHAVKVQVQGGQADYQWMEVTAGGTVAEEAASCAPVRFYPRLVRAVS